MSGHVMRFDQGLERRFYPRRYWNAFVSGSLLVHLLVVAMFYNASLFKLFDTGAPKPQAPQALYVAVQEEEPPKAPVPEPAPAAPRPSPRPSPVKAVRKAPSDAAPKPAPDATPVKKEAVAEEDVHVPPPVAADRDADAVVVIKGTQKTVYAATPRAYDLKAARTGASAPGPAREAVKEKGAAANEAVRPQEFNLYSTAGKSLDIPSARQPTPGAVERGQDASSRRPGLADLLPGAEKPKEATGQPAGQAQPRFTTVAKADARAGAVADEYKGIATAGPPDAKRSGPAASSPPRLPVAAAGSASRAGQSGQAAPSASPGGVPGGAGSEKQLGLRGRTAGPPAAGVQEPHIGPKTLPQESRAVVEVPLPYVTITSPVDKSEVDAYKDKYVTITGEVGGGTFTSVRIRLNSGYYEAPVTGGKFRLQARIDTEENVLFAEGTDSAGETARSKTVKFWAANLLTRDIVIKASYKGDGATTAFDCRFKLHPLSEKRRPGLPEFHVEDGSAKGSVVVASAPAGIYTIGVKCAAAPGKFVEAVFEVTLYGYDQARKKVRKIGPLKLKGGSRAYPVRVLMPECVFWEDEGWFTGVIQGGTGTTKYREPEGVIWKEEE